MPAPHVAGAALALILATTAATEPPATVDDQPTAVVEVLSAPGINGGDEASVINIGCKME